MKFGGTLQSFNHPHVPQSVFRGKHLWYVSQYAVAEVVHFPDIDISAIPDINLF
jgi:hypothetical protein